MKKLVDSSASFGRAFKLRTGDIINNLTDNEELVVWYGVKETSLKFAPCKEFAEIIKKFKGGF